MLPSLLVRKTVRSEFQFFFLEMKENKVLKMSKYSC